MSSAAHAELFAGNFKVPEMGFMNLLAIDGRGEFVNAPYNRCVCLNDVYGQPMTLAQFYNLGFKYDNQADHTLVGERSELRRDGMILFELLHRI